jgi:hypothetical protein
MKPGVQTAGKGKTIIGAAEWKLCLIFFAATCLMFLATHTSLSIGRAGEALAIFPVLAVATLVYRYIRPDPKLADLLGVVLVLGLILFLGMLISFAAAVLGGRFDYRDPWLQSADAAFGFDWAAYIGLISGHPLVADTMKFAYASLVSQFFVVAIALVMASQRRRLKIYILAVGSTLAVTLAIFVFMPAQAHQSGALLAALNEMRSSGVHTVSVDKLNGIISFPSYHTQAACLFIWACWRMPYLRWPVLFLNLVLIAATPIDGGHYAADVLAGALIAAATVFLLSCDRERVLRRMKAAMSAHAALLGRPRISGED